MRHLRCVDVWAAGILAASLLAPAWAAEAPSGGRNLPPVVELGVGGAPASSPPSREALADLLQQLESLQTELRNLRGQVEVQTNEIERLKARQRDLLADIDRRVTELERRGVSAPSPESAPAAESAAPGPAGQAASAQEQKDYDAAFSLMKQGNYERAAKGFRDFIVKYPQGSLRDNAQYWLGEAYYVTRDFRKALTEFSRLMSEYPKSPKAPDGLLKIGYSHYELGEWAKARDHLNQVVARYPGQPAAKSAEQRLAKMKKQGH
ncbi:MAG: tol-pal system protein YbgF [Gammaproteobacteria bacterium]|nr:tol-pal system protein YbgF [Gammaproteobacteria bacterium]